MDEKISRAEALKKIGMFIIGIGFISFFAKRVFADVFFTGADTSTGINVDFITYDIETGLLTLGKAGDIILGDSTLRKMYPQTDVKIDLGDATHRFNDVYTGQITITDAKNIVLATGTGTIIGTTTSQKLGFFAKAPVIQQVDGATLTNSVTVGGTTNTIADFTSLTVYATDAAAIRNDIYQLARKQKITTDALRALGLLS